MKYAIKEQRQYKTNFFASIATMIFNDACFIVIFLIFLWYFSSSWLTLANFLILMSITCLWYWITHGLFSNIWALSEIIEQWKLDYYLSFPTKPLYFLATTKVGIIDLWDIVFWLICLVLYAFIFTEESVLIILMKWIWLMILSSLIMIWLYILVWSISFRLQKGSKIEELFQSMFFSFSNYPPEVYNENRLIYIFLCMLLFPSVILPYNIMMNGSMWVEWVMLILFCIITLTLWIWVFNRWLRRYSSGNLVHQM